MLECHLLKTIQESDLFHYLVVSYKIDHWYTRGATKIRRNIRGVDYTQSISTILYTFLIKCIVCDSISEENWDRGVKY